MADSTVQGIECFLSSIPSAICLRSISSNERFHQIDKAWLGLADQIPNDLDEYFGEEVTDIVNGVTKIGQLIFGDKTTQQAEYIRKMVLSMSQDIRVLLVKLADRVHNMRTLGYMDLARQKRIARETLDIYAPLAGRLGMFRLKAELEDLAFFFLEPEAYHQIQEGLILKNGLN